MHCKVRVVMDRVDERLYWDVDVLCGGLIMEKSALRCPLAMPADLQCIGYGNDGIRVISVHCVWEMMICGLVMQSPW